MAPGNLPEPPQLFCAVKLGPVVRGLCGSVAQGTGGQGGESCSGAQQHC